MQISRARSGARILGLALHSAGRRGRPLPRRQPQGQGQGRARPAPGHQRPPRSPRSPNTPGTIQVGCCNPVPHERRADGLDRRRPCRPAASPTSRRTSRHLRAKNTNTFTVGAGDMIGASPLISALFHDEPTIEALNSIGFDDVGVGNHEFDEGIDELQRMQYGNQHGGDGCHPVDGCQDGTPFGGAFYKYLAANVFYEGTDETIFPPYEIKKVDGAKIAFIGLTFEATPTVVTPSGVAGLRLRAGGRDDQRARAKLARRAGRQGVRRAAAPGRHQAAARAGLPGPGRPARRLHRRQQVRELQRPGDPGHRRRPRPARRDDHLRPHAPAVHLPDVRQARHQRRVVRPRGDRDRPDDRPPDQGRSARPRPTNQIVTQDVAQGPGRRGDPATSTRSCRRRWPTRSSATITADIRSARDTRAARTPPASSRWAT